AGKGSTFHFIVQLGLQKGPRVCRIPEKPANLEGLRVLVVDDNATNRRILEEMLRNWRMRPITADGGPAALELLAEASSGEPFRLLILDVNMPFMDGFEVAEKIREHPGLVGSPIMVITSSGMRGDAARCRELGIAAYLTKPVKQSALLDAIMTVLGTTEPEGIDAPLITQYTLREEHHPLRVLLAEDNEVNRKIALGMLEKRGHTVVTAENGKETLAALEAQVGHPFDLILMDVQMPEMDGLEATARIRENEKGSERHVPIIALTAHAMKGDREACLAAGMDGYISKPLKAEELVKTMEEVIADRDGILSGDQLTCAAPGLFDMAQALAGVDGDLDLFREVVGLFLKEYPKTMKEIREAIDESDPLRLNWAAHALKGSVGNFGACGVFDLAKRLEMMGGENALNGAEETRIALEKELVCLKKVLENIVMEMTHENSDS
ncbi:MAG: response regulator, partial [Geobacteraceae bacterium]|nr:response regulator [Geobacteraceae bacterium]